MMFFYFVDPELSDDSNDEDPPNTPHDHPGVDDGFFPDATNHHHPKSDHDHPDDRRHHDHNGDIPPRHKPSFPTYPDYEGETVRQTTYCNEN